MSSLSEIQDAITRLPSEEKRALQLWLNSQVEPEMTADEEQALLRSLGDAMQVMDTGKGIPLDEVRKRVGSWAGK